MAFAGLKKQINKANQVNIHIILLLYVTNSFKFYIANIYVKLVSEFKNMYTKK